MINFLRKFIIGEWNIGISNTDFINEFSKVKQGGCLTIPVKWVRHNREGSFFADPFIYRIDDSSVDILAEEFIYSRSKGIISLCTVDRESAKMINRTEVLEETCHLSYPFYNSDTRTFSPESFRNGNWATYGFADGKVGKKQILCDLKLIDATPVDWNGTQFIFATTQPNALSELFIYYKDNQSGQILPHPLNPVKNDVRTARCGGKFFTYNGNLFRVVQDSTHRYGEAIHIMKITELSENGFAEELYCDVTLDSNGKYTLGVHTLNFSKDIIIVDGYREKYRPLFAIYIYKIVPILRKLRMKR